jgi:hypothetical protein
MSFRGRHFDPAGSAKPHWKEILLLGCFLGLNAVLWLVPF